MVFSCFSCWNRLSSKKKSTERWKWQLTPWNFLVSLWVFPWWPLDAGSLQGSLGARCCSTWLGSAGKAACPTQLCKANSTSGHKDRVVTDIFEIPATQTTVGVSQMGSFGWQMPFSLLLPQQNWACPLCSCIPFPGQPCKHVLTLLSEPGPYFQHTVVETGVHLALQNTTLEFLLLYQQQKMPFLKNFTKKWHNS